MAMYISIGVSICAFVAVWVRVGVYKGSTDVRIKNVEDKTAALDTKVDSMGNGQHSFEVELSAFMSEMRTSMKFIFDGIAELKKKQECQDAEKK